MPLCDDLCDDEEPLLDHWRFPDCADCANRFKPRLCGDCDNGEHFEEIGPAGIDSLLHL